MKFQWESDEERRRRFMKISPLKKLIWLQKMNELAEKNSPRKRRFFRQHLRGTKLS